LLKGDFSLRDIFKKGGDSAKESNSRQLSERVREKGSAIGRTEEEGRGKKGLIPRPWRRAKAKRRDERKQNGEKGGLDGSFLYFPAKLKRNGRGGRENSRGSFTRETEKGREKDGGGRGRNLHHFVP